MTGEGARLFVALTSESGSDAAALAAPLRGLPLGFKIGLELFTRLGPRLVEDLVEAGFDVFLDLKFHDIPHTVAGAVRSACALGPSIVNVHASGGMEMMRAAAAASEGMPTRIIAVTVLTSLDRGDLELLGSSLDPGSVVPRLARAAREAGLAGVVCSPLEASAVRKECGGGFLIVTPGIRPGGSPLGDQKRVATAAEAVLAGADVLVVGRPVTGAPDPGLAAAALLEEMGAALKERHAGDGPA